MAYPGSIPSFAGFTAGNTLAADNHAAQHNLEQSEIVAIATKIGTGASTPSSGQVLRSTGAGVSSWGSVVQTTDITGITPVANGGTGQNSLSNLPLSAPVISGNVTGGGTYTSPTLVTPSVDTVNESTPANGVSIDGLNIKDSKLTTADSVVTANVTNDAITATKIDWASTGADGGIWWEEIGRTTLGGAGDTITLSSVPVRKYLCVLISLKATGGTINAGIRFNNDSATNYASRSSANGGADGTSGSVAQAGLAVTDSAADKYIVINLVNIAAQEKILYASTVESNTSGAANVPGKAEVVGKWANTSAAISRIDVINTTGTGDFAIGSEVVVLGHD